MAYLILNAAMIPNEGTFTYRLISRAQAGEWLQRRGQHAASYLGYPQTQQHLCEVWDEQHNRTCYPAGHCICGARHQDPAQLPIALNRAKCSMEPGDEALVCRLAYRVENPATKGQPQAEDWEYGILTRLYPGVASLV